MARAFVFLVMIGLAVYAVAGIAASDERERLGLPKGPWFVVALVPFVGPLAWIVVSRRARHEAGGAGTAGGTTARPTPRRTGPLAPDDDPEFLWRLEQDRLRREREAGQGGPGSPRPSDGDVPDDGTRG